MTDREKKKLEKIIFYILARRPDEFGLLPDEKGFVRVKDLYKALSEEKIIKNFNIKRLIDFFLVFQPDKFEYLEKDKLVRAKPELISPEVLKKELAEDVPLKLFIPVRPKAWIKAVEEGLKADMLVLTPDKGLAERLARRRGALIIEVDALNAQNMGSIFERYLQKIYITSWIPPSALKGPKVDEKFKKRYIKEKKEEIEAATPLFIDVPFSYKPSREKHLRKKKHRRTHQKG